VELFIFGTAEPASAIMACSIPVLRVLVTRQRRQKTVDFIDLDWSKQKNLSLAEIKVYEKMDQK